MVKIENTKIYGLDETLVRSVRMPFKSFDKSDSYRDDNGEFHLGENDLHLMETLAHSKQGDSDSKFKRRIFVTTEFTLPQYIIAELATYKVGTVMNSSSIQHIGMKRDYTWSDFSFEEDMDSKSAEAFGALLQAINMNRQKYKSTKNYKYFRIMRQLIPMSFNYTISFACNYQVLQHIWSDRHNHRLKEWHDICEWIEELPYAKELILPLLPQGGDSDYPNAVNEII